MTLLSVHLFVAYAVAVLAVIAIWRRSDRRIQLYVVTVQIIIGIVLVMSHLRAPSLHYALAAIGWAGYMVANALSRREGKERLGIAVAVLSSALLIWTFSIGMHAVKAGGG